VDNQHVTEHRSDHGGHRYPKASISPEEHPTTMAAGRKHTNMMSHCLQKSQIYETPENETGVLKTMVVAVPWLWPLKAPLKGIIIFLNMMHSEKMHPIKHRIQHLEDIEEWYSGSTNIHNTWHACRGIEKSPE
jgi:hypothetical protein